QRRNEGSRLGRRTNASPPVTSWRMPSRTIPGAGSGYVKLGQTQPVLPREVPLPTALRSSTSTSAPARRSSHAHARPITPAPPTTKPPPITSPPGSGTPSFWPGGGRGEWGAGGDGASGGSRAGFGGEPPPWPDGGGAPRRSKPRGSSRPPRVLQRRSPPSRT